ncbi:MAG: D-alanyl-D-alanine carboxypeptidase [Eubacteriales bacterium]|nr:D-alanyl-D-alanine carboxypeptidase [Eubacteriales bacterium]
MKILVALLVASSMFSQNVFALSAKSAVLIDAQVGRIIYENNAHIISEPASTTKIMTALLAIEKGDLEKEIKISKRASIVEGSSIWLGEGEKITLENLLYGLMLSSGNDAALAIAEGLCGSERKFVSLMNKRAKEMNLKQTHFENPHGLPSENHYTTAYELAIITKEALSNKTFSRVVSTKKKTIPWEGHTYNRCLTNHNKLLSLYEGADGIKTGYTKSAGRTLVSSATRNGVKLIAVTFGAPDDWNDHKFLLDYGFERCESKLIAPAGETVRSITIENGKKESVGCVVSEDIYAVINDDSNKFKVKYTDIPKSVEAPVSKGEVLGKGTLYYNGKKIKQVDLVAFESVSEKPPLSIWQKIKMFF